MKSRTSDPYSIEKKQPSPPEALEGWTSSSEASVLLVCGSSASP
ncbi:hypothetical protein N6H18_03345 [Reichenbachiella agarivorans]|uniref:Uncharacterized protein n=1 Tax=Reichenbachiella agarivorans TaxID=2979464 RepID=A0ABY6CR51_9BACT|nr:hypothetical protein [Reichenbachiella agarivorans]UXP32990.1 hypothetical protein N6H18_03345 [Reichenbachiella agarivorans]